MNQSEIILAVDSVHKRFGDTLAVDGVSIDINSAEIICLLGPSGCGKTTLLRLIAGLETPDAGHIQFEGADISQQPIHTRGFGMMFQSFALFPHLNVFENIAYGLRMMKRNSAEITTRVTEMLALVDLTGYEQRAIDQLSGGQQQRVALARALATEPRLLMLDEPLGSLDQSLREKLMVELRDIIRRVGVTALYVTHDQSEAYAVADRVAVMNAGRIEQLAPPEQIYGQPATAFVAEFLGLSNVIEGVLRGAGVIETEIGQLVGPQDKSGLPDGDIKVLIRPNALSIKPTENKISAILTNTTFRGRYYELRFQTKAGELEFEVGDPTHWQSAEQQDLFLENDAIQLLKA